MKTAITELFDIQHPILNAGMGRIAYPEMVIAVCNAGGLGVYGAGSNPPERVREDIRRIRPRNRGSSLSRKRTGKQGQGNDRQHEKNRNRASMIALLNS